jgi:hypothetical protein
MSTDTIAPVTPFKEEMKLTIFGLGGIGNTFKAEAKIVQKYNDRWVIVYKGKRKKFYLVMDENSLVFEGWELPIKSDIEVFGNKAIWNGYLNLGGMEKEELKKFIQEKNFNPDFKSLSNIKYVTKDIDVESNDNYQPLFEPELKVPEQAYHGTDGYYKYLMGTKLTSGVKALAEEYGCFWFLDVITSVQHMEKVKAEGFQVWKLTRVKDDEFKVVMEDGNDNVIYKQKIGFSNFKDDTLTLWLVDSVILLPSEY